MIPSEDTVLYLLLLLQPPVYHWVAGAERGAGIVSLELVGPATGIPREAPVVFIFLFEMKQKGIFVKTQTSQINGTLGFSEVKEIYSMYLKYFSKSIQNSRLKILHLNWTS